VKLALLLVLSALPLRAADDPTEISKRSNQYTYIEQADFFSVDKKGRITKDRSVTNEIIFVELFTPGSTFTWDYDKINDDAWLMTSGVLEARLQFVKIIKPQVRTEYKNSKFQKFDVQSTITTEPVK
jgi:hypothetical protein